MKNSKSRENPVRQIISEIDQFLYGGDSNTKKIPDPPLDDSQDEQNAIDNYILFTSTTLIAGSLTILYSTKVNSQISDIVAVITTLGFMLSLFLTIWHKYRYNIRSRLYLEKKRKWVTETKTGLAKLIQHVGELISLRKKVYLYEHENELRNKDVSEVRSILRDVFNEEEYKKYTAEFNYIVESLSHYWADTAIKNLKLSFNTPLDEAHAKPKYKLDTFSKNFRYHFFAFSTVSFVVLLLLTLLD